MLIALLLYHNFPLLTRLTKHHLPFSGLKFLYTSRSAIKYVTTTHYWHTNCRCSPDPSLFTSHIFNITYRNKRFPWKQCDLSMRIHIPQLQQIGWCQIAQLSPKVEHLYRKKSRKHLLASAATVGMHWLSVLLVWGMHA